ncbi:MAG TPA: UDP-N-acetylglucosamine 1-carboxyvinyltransferase [Candidatus Dormibacteraeota bacterium]
MVTWPRDRTLIVRGGRPLSGTICVSGSKNASLPILAACLLTGETVTLRNVPRIADTELMVQILQSLGCEASRGEGSITVRAGRLDTTHVDRVLGRRMRASIVLLGPLLGRAGAVRLPKPGGDEIGMRRVEQHVRGLTQMGARILDRGTEIEATAPDGLHGARVVLDMPTVTGTENIVMAAVLARGRTEILNAAREPHVQDLCRFLISIGAIIEGAGTDTLVVEGVDALGGGEHSVISDYLEAGTFAIAVAATGGEVRLECSPPEDLESPVLKLREAGADVEVEPGAMTLRRERPLRPVDLVTWVHPGYPTDLQAPYTALMTQADGEAVVSEYIFENRFQHVQELLRMGADIEMHGRTAIVRGPSRLRGGPITIPDIRAGAALVIGALCAEGETELREAWHIERGYEDMAGKLRQLGAEVHLGEESPAGEAEHHTYE